MLASKDPKRDSDRSEENSKVNFLGYECQTFGFFPIVAIHDFNNKIEKFSTLPLLNLLC